MLVSPFYHENIQMKTFSGVYGAISVDLFFVFARDKIS
jgi:hypothetical protein